MSAPLRLAAYTDATIFGGAEHSLSVLLGGLAGRLSASLTLIAVDDAVARRIAAGTPGLRVVLAAPVAGKTDLRAIGAHVRAFASAAPDVAQINLRTPWACQYGLLGAALRPGTRIVAVQHSPIPTGDAAQRFLRSLLNRRVAAHVAVSEAAARMVEAGYALPPGRVRVIRNGSREGAVEPAARAAAGPVVACVARLSPEKGVDVLIRALARLEGVTALILGDGPERGALERLAAEVGVAGRARFAGWVDDPRPQLAAADLLVSPSRFEAMPQSVIEGMLAGLAVVATDVGGVSEAVLQDRTGLLVAPGDPDALAGAIAEVLGDPPRRAAMGAAGRALAREHYTLDAMVGAYTALYGDIRSARGGLRGWARNPGEWS